MLGTLPASTACSAIADWMGQQLGSGRMSGSMMWGSPSALGATCRQWMGSGSRTAISGTASPAWCDYMVNLMEQHVGNWDSWMTQGNMMGK
jgi:hypothetical protein